MYWCAVLPIRAEMGNWRGTSRHEGGRGINRAARERRAHAIQDFRLRLGRERREELTMEIEFERRCAEV